MRSGFVEHMVQGHLEQINNNVDVSHWEALHNLHSQSAYLLFSDKLISFIK